MSSEAAIVAREIQDLSTAVDGVSTAIREQQTTVNVNVPEQQAPTINVAVPEQKAPVVNVNVPEQKTPVVNVEPSKVDVKPQINVLPSLPTPYRVRITRRDSNGFISEFVILPDSAT